MSDDAVMGAMRARRMYAQAWADATGAELEPVEFTPEFLTEKVREHRREYAARVRECEELATDLTTALRPSATSASWPSACAARTQRTPGICCGSAIRRGSSIRFCERKHNGTT